MSTPAKSFEDLRSILGKLDRKIDSARSRRLGLDPEPEDGVFRQDDGPLIGKAEDAEQDAEQSVQDAVDADESSRRRSPYGRAKPLNRGSSNGAASGWLGGA